MLIFLDQIIITPLHISEVYVLDTRESRLALVVYMHPDLLGSGSFDYLD